MYLSKKECIRQGKNNKKNILNLLTYFVNGMHIPVFAKCLFLLNPLLYRILSDIAL